MASYEDYLTDILGGAPESYSETAWNDFIHQKYLADAAEKAKLAPGRTNLGLSEQDLAQQLIDMRSGEVEQETQLRGDTYDAAIEDVGLSADVTRGVRGQQLSDIEGYGPVSDKYWEQTSEGLDPSTYMGLATADVEKAYSDAPKTISRAAGRQGINVGSKKYQDMLEQTLGLEKTKDLVMAKENARRYVDETNYNRLGQGMNVGNRALSPSNLNTAVSPNTPAVNVSGSGGGSSGGGGPSYQSTPAAAVPPDKKDLGGYATEAGGRMIGDISGAVGTRIGTGITDWLIDMLP